MLSATGQEIQSVIFKVGDEACSLDIGYVQEIIRFPLLTPLPGTADYVLGIMNLRGDIVPVIDLKKILGLGVFENMPSSRVIVLEHQRRKVGLSVDQVLEVNRLSWSPLSELANWQREIDRGFVSGVAQIKERLILILEPEKLLFVGIS